MIIMSSVLSGVYVICGDMFCAGPEPQETAEFGMLDALMVHGADTVALTMKCVEADAITTTARDAIRLSNSLRMIPRLLNRSP